jgi:uncharacterized protein (DUF433 family)
VRSELYMANSFWEYWMVEQSFAHCDQEILGGTLVFTGTRVPLRNLIDYLEKGHGLDEFLDAFPSVSREQAIAAFEAAHDF